MKLIPIFFALILLTAIAAPAQKVRVDHDSSINFSSFKTFGWSDGQVSRNATVAQIITSGIERELVAKGLTRNDSNPDIKIAVMAAVGMDLQGVGPSWNNAEYKSWGGYGNAAALMNVSTGTLLIDLLETKNKMSVWRGVAKQTLHSPAIGVPSDSEIRKVEKQINSALKKMFRQYPAGPTS